MSFKLAHLSDVHLPVLGAGQVLRNFKGKRVIGGFSWFLNRRRRHLLSVANALKASILAAEVDHVALTGDLVNIAAWDEFPAAANWIKDFGAPSNLSFVPGNHDAYVTVPWSNGLQHLAPWMKPDKHEPQDDTLLFPYVRMRRNVALIGINSGQPQNYLKASGTVGEQQLRDLQHVLNMLGSQGFYRVVMIHHPPLPNLCKPRKALTDASALKDVLIAEGCELVLHGHNHKSMLNWFETKSGPTPVVGVPSASINGDEKHEPAGWNLFHIRRQQGRWITDITEHRWNSAKQSIATKATATLLPP